MAKKKIILQAARIQAHDKIIFLDKKEDDPDREARVNYVFEDGAMSIANLNMPYCGTISTVLSRGDINWMIKSGEIRIERRK